MSEQPITSRFTSLISPKVMMEDDPLYYVLMCSRIGSTTHVRRPNNEGLIYVKTQDTGNLRKDWSLESDV